MGLQETTDILITFFQNIFLLLNLQAINISWPDELKGPIEFIRSLVAFDAVQTLAGMATDRVKELDVHIMLIVKNSILPLVVSLVVILPMKRWYYIAWWLVSVIFAIIFSALAITSSFYAQQPSTLHWMIPIHYQKSLYDLSYTPGNPLPADKYTIMQNDSTFNLFYALGFGAGAFIAILLFLLLIGTGILICFVQFIIKKRKFAVTLEQMKKKAPPGKKVNVTKLRYRMIYENIRDTQQRELELKLTSYWTRISPLFVILIIEVFILAGAVYLKDYLDSMEVEFEGTLFYGVLGLVAFIVCAVVCFLLLCNSLVLFMKMRILIFKINHFLTSKALKLTFLVLSSFYIPLAVSIFSLFDCVKVTCDEGSIFSNRKDEYSQHGYIIKILQQLTKTSEICTSCQYDISTSDLQLYGSTADAFCTPSQQATLCPGGEESRLLRQPSIACSSTYPYVATAGAFCCLFVVTTPFLILYLINLATRQMGSVEVPHLLQFKARQLRRAMKNKMEDARGQEVHPYELPDLDTFMKIDGSQEAKPSFIKRLLTTTPLKAVNWEMRLSLVDCSIESLYFPFKYNFRYFKLIFLIAKVILSFTNVFGVTVFGQLEKENTIGPQLVLWITFIVQFFLGAITLILRPYVLLAETVLMVISAVSICANCLFGLALIYTGIEAPGWIVVTFMTLNSIILGFASVMSIAFYFYRIKKYDWKRVQRKMKSLLKKRSESKKPLTEAQTAKYWRGKGSKHKEPYLDIDMLQYPQKHLKDIKSATKYQKAVAYSLNRTSLNILINFFFFLSIITAIAGVLLGAHYVILFLNPKYVDPYIQNRLRVFSSPVNVERLGSVSLSTFANWAQVNIDTSDRPDRRKDTEIALENVFYFGSFPNSMCEDLYNATFAGYNSWGEFTDNCCCTRDLAFENANANGTFHKNLEVEQWRCKNGLISRRIRSIEVQMSATSSVNFRISKNNFVDKFTKLDGYAMRGFCEKNFNPDYSLTNERNTACAGFTRFRKYEKEFGQKIQEMINEVWSGNIVIRPEVVNDDGYAKYDGTTEIYEDPTFSNREFHAVIWDSVKNIISRTLLW